MRIAIGADHAGYELKESIETHLKELGHEVTDVGTHSTEPSDYPDSAEAVANEVASKRSERGVILCGSGVGASIAANKVPGIRAGNVMDAYSAHQGVEHDDMNVLVLGARVIGIELARELVKAYLGARYSGEHRHARRLAKLLAIEAKHTR